jgi:hypothetical protein
VSIFGSKSIYIVVTVFSTIVIGHGENQPFNEILSVRQIQKSPPLTILQVPPEIWYTTLASAPQKPSKKHAFRKYPIICVIVN